MKRSIKLLALALATLLTATSLLACKNTANSTTADPQSTGPVVGKEGMMPSDIREILPKVEYVKFKVEYQSGDAFCYEYHFHLHQYFDMSNPSNIPIQRQQYIDCESGTVYDNQLDTNNWFPHEGSKDAWMELLNQYFFENEQMNSAFNTKSYGKQNEDDSYDAKLGYFPLSVKSVNFKENKPAYIFTFEMEDPSSINDDVHPIIKVIVSIWFVEHPVNLPTNG